MTKEQIHSASFRARDASHYLAIAYAYALNTPDRELWPLKVAIESLTEAADALGFDLVKRPPVSTVTILPMDPEEEAA
jgi:hypothetical protein